MIELDRESVIGITALLVHAANIDENYSDQHLCNYEDRLIRKVSGLIYIESKDLGAIRLKVKNDLHS